MASRQLESDPNPRLYVMSAAIGAIGTVGMIVFAAVAHAVRSYSSGPPWWAYFILAIVSAVSVVFNLHRAARDRRRLTTLA